MPFLVGAQGTKPLPVYRFYNFKLGSHFYTASEVEKNDVLRKYSSTFSFEGISYGLDASATANSDSLYRFYNVKNGSHFYTANPAERDNVRLKFSSIYTYEGPVYKISRTNVPATLPVFRFYNVKNGTHFYTANPAERDNVRLKYSSTYRDEGIAYYYTPPW